MITEKFDLKQLLDHFSDIGKKRWGQTLQLDVLEKVFLPVKNCKEELSPKHLEAIRDDYAFEKWWKMPGIKEEDFSPLEGIFSKLEPHNKEIVGKLFDLVKNIEIVSCILRFIDPQNYGIMSPPVENILNVKGKHPIEKYMNYLKNLDELKEEYNFSRIADVDMALWALANILNYSHLRHYPTYYDIYEVYEQTANPVKKIMARNSLEQLKEEKPLFKAELFLDSDYVMAGLVAGREADLFVKELSKNNGIKLLERTRRMDVRYLTVPELAEMFFTRKLITREEKENIKKWWKYRCDLVHEGKISITPENVKEMIEGINKLKEKYLI